MAKLFITNALKKSNMKSILTIILTVSAFHVFSQEVTGYWKTIDDDSGEPKSIVHVYKNADGTLTGKVVQLFRKPHEDQDPVCEDCPKDDYRHGQKVKGMVIMSGMEKDGEVYSGGEILDPENGSTYRCKIWLEGQGKLKVRGYLGPFFRTQTWLREQGHK